MDQNHYDDPPKSPKRAELQLPYGMQQPVYAYQPNAPFVSYHQESSAPIVTPFGYPVGTSQQMMFQPAGQSMFPQGQQMFPQAGTCGLAIVEAQQELTPPWGLVLAESIVGIVCNCACGWCAICWIGLLGLISLFTGMIGAVIGAIGLVYAIMSQRNRNQQHHRISHYLGIASLSCIVVDCVIGVILLIIAIFVIWYRFDAILNNCILR